ncbi:MAG: protein kinase [Pirellulaceae bacterium]
MGSVYMAEQIDPVERRVALKIIKPGMDTKTVVARFEAERQALAMMDHPNIAKVLDVGTTNSGRPYFVMELVRGVPITQYCDDHHLTPRERLGLFLPVCQAVQHRIKRESSTATSSRPTCWSPSTTTAPCPRSSTLGWPKRWRSD